MSDIVQKPWGTYEVLHEEPGVKVKRIVVFPGKRTSLQRHKHRDEMWFFISGKGFIEYEDFSGSWEKTIIAGDREFIYKNTWHRVENEGLDNLVFIEVQTGDVLDEDDIERKEDDYGRC